MQAPRRAADARIATCEVALRHRRVQALRPGRSARHRRGRRRRERNCAHAHEPRGWMAVRRLGGRGWPGMQGREERRRRPLQMSRGGLAEEERRRTARTAACRPRARSRAGTCGGTRAAASPSRHRLPVRRHRPNHMTARRTAPPHCPTRARSACRTCRCGPRKQARAPVASVRAADAADASAWLLFVRGLCSPAGPGVGRPSDGT